MEKKTDKKYYWKMDGQIYEVSKEKYAEYRKEYDRYKKLKKDQENANITIVSLDTRNEYGEDEALYIADESIDVEEEVFRKLLFEKLWDGLRTLTADDFYLINEIFLKDENERKSIREIAKILNISHTAVKKKKDKILSYLKNFLEN